MCACPAGRPSSFVSIAPYYDILMRDIPYASWKRYVYELVAAEGKREILAPNARILDLACGTGTLALMVAADGYNVTGVDISAEMIEEARRKLSATELPAEFVVQDAASLDVGEQVYALCFSLFDSLNYVTDPEDLQEAFRRVHKALVGNGLFVFDLNTPFALRARMFDQHELGKDAPIRYVWTSSFDEATSLCTVRMDFWVDRADGEVEHISETHVQRAYEDEDITSMLAEAGFARISAYHAYTFAKPTPRTDRVFYAAHPEAS